jgi:hypothetical protein
MRCKRPLIVLALLLVSAVVLGTGCRAATLGQTAVECSSFYPGKAKVTFNWTPGTPKGVVQYLDLSLSDNGFAPGTFVSAGPLPGDASTYAWDGLAPGAAHVFRVGTFDGTSWWPSTTGSVTTGGCAVPPPPAMLDIQACLGYLSGLVGIDYGSAVGACQRAEAFADNWETGYCVAWLIGLNRPMGETECRMAWSSGHRAGNHSLAGCIAWLLGDVQLGGRQIDCAAFVYGY